ncbi:GNAT family N-acetyltransferase [Halobacillus yeomjeoni]|uniref:GNAT family N-acetyltransferase n=1 Tax=Halobacillus yeomjeoni TaxID=311194 RepID=UPI001CD4E266|nr:GNAT family N-acetyltransferase [Halobacillus yeomjeoni]MCA0983515.1 GNAT family N-acetyltransferase [Halobacillus yeomjeoni]
MIHELDKAAFHKCEPLINDEGHLEVKAVIEGNNPGRVFVDCIDSPRTGLIWLGNHDGFFFIGDEENEVFNNQINEFLNGVIFPEAKKLGLSNFIAIGNHSKWEGTIEKVFVNREMQVSNQKVYTLSTNYKNNNVPFIQEDYKVLKIDKEFYINESDVIDNIGFLHSKISEFWSSPEDFFVMGLGYCIVHQNKIVSLCFSSFVAENVHALDIETIEDHRGNKLGQKAAHCVVNEMVREGIIPYWDCDEANKPSNAVAQNMGLQNHLNYLVYIFPMD